MLLQPCPEERVFPSFSLCDNDLRSDIRPDERKASFHRALHSGISGFRCVIWSAVYSKRELQRLSLELEVSVAHTMPCHGTFRIYDTVHLLDTFN